VEEPRRSFGGGCCSGGALGGQDTLSEEELRSIGLQFYGESVPGGNLDQVTAQVLDFGCHQEIHIYQEGILVLKVGYSYGQVYRIP